MTVLAAHLLAPWRRTASATAGLYLHFVRLAFLKFLAYRLRYYTGVISYTIFVAGYYYLYHALFASRAPGPDGIVEMGGLSVQQMITYVAVGWIGRSFYFNNIGRDLMHQVREGHIAMQLIKPYDLQSVMMFEVVGEAAFRLLMFTLPICVVVVPLFGIRPPDDPALLGWTVLSFTLALVVYSQLNFLVGCLAFHMKNIDGVLRAKMVSGDFLAGVIVPFSFFPEGVQHVLAWLPFQAIGYVPVMIYLGKRPGDQLWQALAVQLAWGVGLWLAGRMAFRASLRRVVVQGG
ncbi:MAG TPA: ABC-2 family transporter protein [Candidatus Krumholzibacteria bacterium]|nr:ABC-2 family transporter protein [Candidatus Krumholzibacteria bacterium]